MHTEYYHFALPYAMKVLRQKSFTFLCLLHVHKTFLYESSRWHCSNMDLRESIRDSAKVFFVCVQLAMKLFCLKTCTVYGILLINVPPGLFKKPKF